MGCATVLPNADEIITATIREIRRRIIKSVPSRPFSGQMKSITRIATNRLRGWIGFDPV
jgi:hypothetical protein